MTFEEVLQHVQDLLQREGRISYRGLKRRFDLDDGYLEDLKAELIKAKRLAIDEDGEVLVWKGSSPVQGSTFKVPRSQDEGPHPATSRTPPLTQDLALRTQHSAAERRQLTVMFCDLVGSTALSEQLDPEEYREVVRAYQESGAEAVRRYDGHVVQHLGDGLLVYFGYPVAHEDDPARAVRAGLEVVEALQSRARQQAGKAPLPHGRGSDPLQVRIGIHAGLVVIGEMGSSEKKEVLALGETPNLAARVQGVAEPDTVAISAVTQRLVSGLFVLQDLGPRTLKGISTPQSVYRVLGEGMAQSRFEAAVSAGLTPLVGRDEELGVLQQRWAQAKQGTGQVVLLNGEPGIGKSRLVQELKEQLVHDGATRIEFHCSPYHQNSALYPIIDHLQRFLQFTREDTPAAKLAKLQQTLARYRFPQADTVPVLAALLSLPHPEGFPPLTMSPQKQKEKTQAALVAWISEEAQQRPVYTVWEDLHWADPSTLEVLTLLLDQVPTARLLALLTSRPEFTSSWRARSYFTQLTLNRLGGSQVEAMVGRVARNATLSAEVIQQIVAKTDGVPLFVEELTKSVVESVGAQQATPASLAIPATLHDSLMARLDRLGPAKEIAQLGATLGREFSYELLHAVVNRDEESLQCGLKQLVAAELVYQRGLPPQARYLFKHALIQDTAYQSLLKSRRQQLHQQIAQVLEEQFAETKETQPELLAHHYTGAGLITQAIPYWQKAGERANQRSAYKEAVAHLTRGLELLTIVPDTRDRAQQELTIRITLGSALFAVKGYTAPEVEKTDRRAWELCQQLGEIPQLFPVLWRLVVSHNIRGEFRVAHELAEQLLRLAQNIQNPELLSSAYGSLGWTLYMLGEFSLARPLLEQGITVYTPQQLSGTDDPRVICLRYAAPTLWNLGYPAQALQRSQEAVALARSLSNPFRLASTLAHAAWDHIHRKEGEIAQELAEETITLSTEQSFPFWAAYGMAVRGIALTQQGQSEEGIAQLQQSRVALKALGASSDRDFLAELAAAQAKVGRVDEGLTLLEEALADVAKTDGHISEVELYRLKGELTLQKEFNDQGATFPVSDARTLIPDAQGEAEACFLKAIEIARKRQAKSRELRVTTSLAHLWQSQGKQHAARNTLSEIYNWFTEGFDTKDLQEAKALLDELSATLPK